MIRMIRMIRITRHLIACYRITRLCLLLIQGMLVIAWRFPHLSTEQKQQRIQAWAQDILKKLAIDFEINGTPPTGGPLLLVANHISWLDIPIMLAAYPCHCVAKSEIKHSPILGMLSAATGTLYIERANRRDAMRVVHHMAEELRSGGVLGVFPEGTTSNGLQLLPFHANLFQAAISAPAPIQPLALRFTDPATGQQSLAPCYIDDDTLLVSMWRTFKTPRLRATVIFGEPQQAEGRDRRAWAEHARDTIGQLLSAPPSR